MDTRDGAWASLMDTAIVRITVTVMAADITIPGVPGAMVVDITEDTIPITEVPTGPVTTTDTTMDITMVQAGAIIQRTITAMAGWIADIPTDMHIDPRRPLEVPRDPLPETPGTEAVLPHQQNQQLPHVPTQE